MLEGLMEGQSRITADLRADLRDLGKRVDRGFEQMDQRFAQLEHRMDGRLQAFDPILASIEQRATAFESRMDHRFDQVDRRFAQVDRRFVDLDSKMSRQFVWLAGVQVSTVLAFMAALVTILVTR
jgi:hypothetical protein